MKKIICTVLAIITVFTFVTSIHVFAESSKIVTETFYYGDKEIIITSTDYFSYDEMQKIADDIVYEHIIQSNKSIRHILDTPLLCQLFGHSIKTATAVEITHNVYTSSPKCLKKTFTVETCTRSNCDYYVKTLISSVRISTCHG